MVLFPVDVESGAADEFLVALLAVVKLEIEIHRSMHQEHSLLCKYVHCGAST